ncbi:MAG: sulfite exporter TauE/SafE family protein [Pseudolabrys sp.]
MPIITDPWFYLVAIPAVTALGLSKGGFSGVGTLAAPLMALVVSPIQAVGILTPILVTQDIVTVWSYWRRWDTHILKIMIPGQVVGVGLAWLIAAYVPDAAIRLVVGVIAVLFALSQWFGLAGRFASEHPSVIAGRLWGLAAGFTSFIANTGGPPFQIYVLPQKLEKETFVGTYSLFFATGNALKVLPYFMLGQLNPVNMSTAALLLPLAVATNIAGVWLVRRTPTEFFYRIVYVLIFLIGLELIYTGTAAVLSG